MTFLTELKRLMDAATKGPFYLDAMDAPDGYAMAWHGNWFVDTNAPKVNGSRYGEPKADAELHCLLRNHADAIEALVKAAQEWETAKHESEGIVTTRAQMDRLHNAERRITVALAALDAAGKEKG